MLNSASHLGLIYTKRQRQCNIKTVLKLATPYIDNSGTT